MTTVSSRSKIDLDLLYEKLDSEIEEDWINRLEEDFGNTDEKHLFVQTDSYNGFLYRDRAILHLLEEDLEGPVYNVLDEFYEMENKI